ncbi:MAG TPA: GIY-YIG nuclease family protein [Candidatus Limnocylindria bacterium]|nr:GIY-YIG nuclease family protein [Candidatus Limnocylindria bacterium]
MDATKAFQYVYVLQNKAGSWYTGCTSDLRKRLREHKAGNSRYTKHRGPYELIYYEACLNKDDAYRRERYLKTGMGRRYLSCRLKLQLEATA